MSESIKGNADIRSDQLAFMTAYSRAREVLGRIEGVAAVGFGRKETAGTLTPNLSITVFVRAKRPEDELAPEQRIPASFDGYRTDVRVLMPVVPTTCDNQTRYQTIQGGIQIQARKLDSSVFGDTNKGTLGCIVRKRGDDSGDNYHLLTAEHVLFHDESDIKSVVHHPSAPASGDTTSSQVIAMIEVDGIRREVEHRATRSDGVIIPIDCYIDCAIARLDLASRCCGIRCSKDNVKYDTGIIDLHPTDSTRNRITDVRDISLDAGIVLGSDDLATATDANRVVKVGRTTGRTVGIVTHVNSAALNGPDIVSGFIEVELDPASTPGGVNCKGNDLFIEHGDSGSLVLDMNYRAIGLAFGSQPRDGRIRSFVCHIVPVLDQLHICIPTASGTAHGSSGATDGSGIALYGGSAEQLHDDGSVLFSGHLATGTATPPQPRLAPRIALDDGIERFLDALGETAEGRQLLDDFARTRLELTYLVRRQRQVKVTWHRNRGPAFLTGLLDHLQGKSAQIPLVIDGVSLSTLLTRMEAVLLAYGSRELRAALERQRDRLMGWAYAETAGECIATLRFTEERHGT